MNRLLSYIATLGLLPRSVPFRCGCIVLFFASCASAAVFERDWKTPGDGLLTYDDVNKRVWLDLSVSRLDQFPEPRLQNAIAQIAPGGLFEGFTWSSRSEVIELAHSAAIDTGTSEPAINQTPTEALMTLLGTTFEGNGPSIRRLESVAFIDEVQTVLGQPRQVGSIFIIHVGPTGGGQAGLSFGTVNDVLFRDSTGLMLYRQVPEPSSTGLVAVLLLILSRCRVISARRILTE